MGLNRYATKRDRTEPGILRAIHKAGARYIRLDAFDVLVLFRGRLIMLECKTKAGRATRNQQSLVAEGWPLVFVKTPEEALQAIGAIDQPLHICQQPGFDVRVNICKGCEPNGKDQ